MYNFPNSKFIVIFGICDQIFQSKYLLFSCDLSDQKTNEEWEIHPKFTRMRNETIESSEKSKKKERYAQKNYGTKIKDLPITFSNR